jgi:uncharacterized protein (TIGR03437 family)
LNTIQRSWGVRNENVNCPQYASYGDQCIRRRGAGAILNQDYSLNSPAHPAAPGSVVMIYSTREGQTDAPGVDGQIAGTTLPQPRLPVSVTIGGVTAEVLYAGAAPGLVAGVLQVNARVPEGTPAGAAVPVALIIGTASSQAGVTLAVQ